jgi:ABC-type Fe3+/spermidine/putrescine transport system ATPase subunit
MAILEVVDISKHFAATAALRQVTLRLEAGKILCLLGPSGCGKTTLLRIIAGLETPDQGSLTFDGADLSRLPPHRRRFGMMFQDYALFPHRNVFENVAFGLRIRNDSQVHIRRRVAEMLHLVGMADFAQRDVSRLSGGERQRVALARSLAPQPRLLMLDEPLGSLDRALRERLMLDLHRIIKEVGVTSLYVTHDHAEAFTVADEVAVMIDGKIEQIDRPENLYRQPGNKDVAGFLGFENLLSAVVDETGAVKSPLGTLYPPRVDAVPGTRLTVLLRPDAARLIDRKGPLEAGETPVTGTVRERMFKGGHSKLVVDAGAGQLLVFDFTHDAMPPPVGRRVRLALQPSAVVLMP